MAASHYQRKRAQRDECGKSERLHAPWINEDSHPDSLNFAAGRGFVDLATIGRGAQLTNGFYSVPESIVIRQPFVLERGRGVRQTRRVVPLCRSSDRTTRPSWHRYDRTCYDK